MSSAWCTPRERDARRLLGRRRRAEARDHHRRAGLRTHPVEGGGREPGHARLAREVGVASHRNPRGRDNGPVSGRHLHGDVTGCRRADPHDGGRCRHVAHGEEEAGIRGYRGRQEDHREHEQKQWPARPSGVVRRQGTTVLRWVRISVSKASRLCPNAFWKFSRRSWPIPNALKYSSIEVKPLRSIR